jgi:hypothetical protein
MHARAGRAGCERAAGHGAGAGAAGAPGRAAAAARARALGLRRRGGRRARPGAAAAVGQPGRGPWRPVRVVAVSGGLARTGSPGRAHAVPDTMHPMSELAEVWKPMLRRQQEHGRTGICFMSVLPVPCSHQRAFRPLPHVIYVTAGSFLASRAQGDAQLLPRSTRASAGRAALRRRRRGWPRRWRRRRALRGERMAAAVMSGVRGGTSLSWKPGLGRERASSWHRRRTARARAQAGRRRGAGAAAERGAGASGALREAE